MTDIENLTGVWFVYDGECPICKMAAQALRIRETLGELRLVDARTDATHQLLDHIKARGLNLDDGMVVYHQGHFYHGATALQFMSVYGGKSGWFNHINRLMFRSNFLAKTLYPPMRTGRNFLLSLRGLKPINNLIDRDKPIFQPVFGTDWHRLPPVMLKHYANLPYCEDVYITRGKMTVWASPLLRIFAPVSRILGGIPLINQSNVPVEVRFESAPNTNELVFNRLFSFAGRRPYRFRSQMSLLRNGQVIEKMKFGLGWRVKFVWLDNKVQLLHCGYSLWIFNYTMPIPLSWILGRVHAEEWAVSDNQFKMFVEIRHPWLGKIYEYRGQFEMLDND